jgi:7-keto-8-aminopelargonate synthetase-like enzyme
MFSTALPAHVAAASLASLDVLKKEAWRIDRLWQNRNKLMNALKGFNTGSTETPIIPIIVKDIESTLKLSEQLYKKGIYAPAIRPPTVKEPRIRITVTAEHSEEDIERLTEAIQEANIPL